MQGAFLSTCKKSTNYVCLCNDCSEDAEKDLYRISFQSLFNLGLNFILMPRLKSLLPGAKSWQVFYEVFSTGHNAFGMDEFFS